MNESLEHQFKQTLKNLGALAGMIDNEKAQAQVIEAVGNISKAHNLVKSAGEVKS